MNDYSHPLSAIRSLREQLPSVLNSNEALRNEVVDELRRLARDLESTRHSIERICALNIWETVVFNTASNMGLFTALEKADQPCSIEYLSGVCNAEPLLVGRILRALVAFGGVRASRPGVSIVYSVSPIGNVFATSGGAAALRFFFEFASPAWIHLPQMLEANSFKSLVGATNTVFNKAYNAPGKTVWEILNETKYTEDFGKTMVSCDFGQNWLDFYPVQERLVMGASVKQDAIFMVDVGGCSGSQCEAFKTRFPQTPGRFVVQDLPNMLPKSVPTGLETMVHDFFKAQPLGGARLYYMRKISHDWPQALLEDILKKISHAMTPGYSKLIIHGWILPEQNAPAFMATQDLNMISIGGGEERTAQLHGEAIDNAGLRVAGVWDPRDGISEGVMECERPII